MKTRPSTPTPAQPRPILQSRLHAMTIEPLENRIAMSTLLGLPAATLSLKSAASSAAAPTHLGGSLHTTPGAHIAATGTSDAPTPTADEEDEETFPDEPTGRFGNEPTIAVNPLDSSNVVIAHVNRLIISHDGGQTFGAAISATLPANFRRGGDDSIAFDSQGNLFWSYLDVHQVMGMDDPSGQIDLFVQKVNAETGALVGAAADVSTTGGGTHSDDKQWIAVDSNPASPFHDNIYLHWTRFDNNPTDEMFSRSTDGGVTFSTPKSVAGGGGEGFRHQANIAVAPNGDVLLTYHTDVGGSAGNGRIEFIRSTNGGADLAAGTVNQKTEPFGDGQATVTTNRPGNRLGYADFLMQGSEVSYVVADTKTPGRLYVIANDDPNNNYNNGDDGDVVMATSTDSGMTWTRQTISHGPAGTLQVFPQGAMDKFGNLAVFWYDTREGVNGAGRDQIAGNADDKLGLDVYATTSTDGGVTFSPDFKVNDNNNRFDPDAGPPSNFNNDNPATSRIGEYNGIAVANGVAYVDWTGNTWSGPTTGSGSPTGQEIYFDAFVIPNAKLPPGISLQGNTPATLNISGDNDFAGENDTIKLVIDPTNAGLLDVFINNPGPTPTYTVPLGILSQINVNGLGGNDTLIVDSTNGLIAMANGIRYDGGTGHDAMQLFQTGGAQVSDVYSIGPNNGDGSSVIAGGAATQTVQFQNIEPVLDLVPALSLFVNASSANNAINYSKGSVAANGLVTIDNFESIEFSNKTHLTINALEGSDQISLHDDVAPTGLTDIAVSGGDPTGSDTLTITGTALADSFTFAGLSPSAGDVTGLAVPIHFIETEHVVLDGQAGDDTFNLKGNAGSISLRGGAGVDTVDFSTAAESVVFDLDAVGVAQRVTSTDAEVTLLDRMENFTGSPFNDILSIDAATFARSIDGFAEPGDKLNFDGQGAVVTVIKTDFNTGTIKTKGYADVTFDRFQVIALQNTPSGGGGFGNPGSNSDAFNTAHIYDDTLFTSGGKPAPGRGPTAVATGLLNNDLFPDMVVVNVLTNNLSILINQGDGTFFDPVNIKSGGVAPQDVVIGDFDGDNHFDLVVSNPGSGNIAFFHGNNDGTFATPTLTLTPKFKPFALAAADIDNNTHLDIVATSKATSAVEVLLGSGAGTFTTSTPVKTVGFQPVDVVVADFNADGFLDVATANNASSNLSLFNGNGTGALTAAVRFATGVRPTGLAVGDLNGDGKLDLAVSNQLSRFVSVLLGVGNAGGAQFHPQLRVAVPGVHLSSAIVVGDFNGDGIADLGLGNTVGTTFTILLGSGLGFYSQPYEFDLGKSGNRTVTGGIAIADLNNDGQLDIMATSNITGDVRVLLRKV